MIEAPGFAPGFSKFSLDRPVYFWVLGDWTERSSLAVPTRGRPKPERPALMQPLTTLYTRLGSTEGISALVNDIVAAHMENPTVKARFLPYLGDPARLAVLKQHLCRFLESGSGGPAKYEGRSMPDAHRGMNINAAEYVAAIDDILAVLRKHNIDEQTQKDVLAIAYSLKGDIVHL